MSKRALATLAMVSLLANVRNNLGKRKILSSESVWVISGVPGRFVLHVLACALVWVALSLVEGHATSALILFFA